MFIEYYLCQRVLVREALDGDPFDTRPSRLSGGCYQVYTRSENQSGACLGSTKWTKHVGSIQVPGVSLVHNPGLDPAKIQLRG